MTRTPPDDSDFGAEGRYLGQVLHRTYFFDPADADRMWPRLYRYAQEAFADDAKGLLEAKFVWELIYNFAPTHYIRRRNDVTVYMNHLRPAPGRPELTLVYDYADLSDVIDTDTVAQWYEPIPLERLDDEVDRYVSEYGDEPRGGVDRVKAMAAVGWSQKGES